MHSYIFIHGRQPSLGVAELEALFGAQAIEKLQPGVSLLSSESKIDGLTLIKRLGGSMRICQPISTLTARSWHELSVQLPDILLKHIDNSGEASRKITLGISVYDVHVSKKQLQGFGLSLKKTLRDEFKIPIRIVPNKAPELNSAQVLHNKLTHEHGFEFVLIRSPQGIVIAQTIAVQDIEAYAARDQARPKRDSKVGMLPPKLAQIIINMAVSTASPHHEKVVLDPFCGTGVVLQEAALMGFDIQGSDIDPRMVDYTDKNLMWLQQQNDFILRRPPETLSDENWRYFQLELADATNHAWRPTPSFIACETYLGRPLSSSPSSDVLQKIIQDVDTIHKKFLQNVASQTKTGFRMCIAVPAWFVGGKIKHLPVLDHLTDIGYTRLSFKHASQNNLIYHRENQIVGRELVVLIRK